MFMGIPVTSAKLKENILNFLVILCYVSNPWSLGSLNLDLLCCRCCSFNGNELSA